MVLLLRKLNLYFTKDPEGVHYFPGGGGVKLFPRGGVQMLISLETHVRTCFFPGEGCPDPLSPSGSAHGQCHHNRDNIYHSHASNHNCQALICQD